MQRAPRRDAGAYRGSCPRHGYVPSMKESKRNNCISGPGGHCSTAAHTPDRTSRSSYTVLHWRAEAALKPAVPRARRNPASACNCICTLRKCVSFMFTRTPRVLSPDTHGRDDFIRTCLHVCETTRALKRP